VVFRATDQWFLSLEHDGLRRKALAEIDRVRWIPRADARGLQQKLRP
jgi:isoleucyl-tRNA synthetase